MIALDIEFLLRYRGGFAMLSVLLWILCGMGILCLMVFCGKRKGVLPESDRDVMISEAVCNTAAASFMLIQLLFPLYGYVMSPLGGSYPGKMDPFDEVFVRNFATLDVYFLEPFVWLEDNSVYSYVMLTAVFCFFAGMFIYKNGLKIKNKKFILILLPLLTVPVIRFYISKVQYRYIVRDIPKYYSLLLFEGIERYLLSAFVMTAVLYGIYALLKKIMRNEVIPLIVILVLSFFAPCIYVAHDGLKAADPVLKYLYFGPDIPLFPIGMIVMKYRTKLLPKTKKGTLIYLFSWLFAGGSSFWLLFQIQYFLSKRAGVSLSAASSCDPSAYAEAMKSLRPIYKTACVPWLIIGLALSMVILSLTLLLRTGNPLTMFFRKHCYLITVLLFFRHLYFELSGHDFKFWTDILKLPKNMLIAVPFIYFGLSVVLAYLIKRFIPGLKKPDRE